MDVAVELLLALGLASCAGLRAWAPLLLVSRLAQHGYLQLQEEFAFLARSEAVLIFAVATAVEVLGDKFAVVDHALDALGTVVRPAAGTLLASSMFVSLDPLTAVVLGLIVGGSSAFTVNAGKALARAQATALAPLHGGLGNAVVSVVEDLLAGLSLVFVVVAPWLAALIAVLLIAGSAWLLVHFLRQGGRLLAWLRGRARVAG